MHIIITIQHSDAYIASRRLATGENTPREVEVSVEVAHLSEPARRLLLISGGGAYPSRLTSLGWAGGQIVPRGSALCAYHLHADLEPEACTAEVLSALLEAAPAAIAAAYDRQQAAAQARADEEARRDAAKQARQEAVIAAYLADPLARPGTIDSRPRLWITLDSERIETHHPRWQEVLGETERRLTADADALTAEERTWIAAHGSQRLQRMLAAGIEHEAVYRDERLALERPGWQYESQVMGASSEPRNVPEEALDVLDEARRTEPAARLVYWTIEHEHEGDCEEQGCDAYDWTGHVVLAEFLGRKIVYGVPVAYAV